MTFNRESEIDVVRERRKMFADEEVGSKLRSKSEFFSDQG